MSKKIYAEPGDFVSVAGKGGIAWVFIEHPEAEEEYFDAESGITMTDFVVDQSRALCRMVGDDRKYVFDVDDLTPLDREAFCGECGQVGCSHDGMDRS